MEKGILLIIMLFSQVNCEAQDVNCYPSGDIFGRPSRCGNNVNEKIDMHNPHAVFEGPMKADDNQNKMMWNLITGQSPVLPLKTLRILPLPSVSQAQLSFIEGSNAFATTLAPKSGPLVSGQPAKLEALQQLAPFFPLPSSSPSSLIFPPSSLISTQSLPLISKGTTDNTLISLSEAGNQLKFPSVPTSIVWKRAPQAQSVHSANKSDQEIYPKTVEKAASQHQQKHHVRFKDQAAISNYRLLKLPRSPDLPAQKTEFKPEYRKSVLDFTGNTQDLRNFNDLAVSYKSYPDQISPSKKRFLVRQLIAPNKLALNRTLTTFVRHKKSGKTSGKHRLKFFSNKKSYLLIPRNVPKRIVKIIPLSKIIQ